MGLYCRPREGRRDTCLKEEAVYKLFVFYSSPEVFSESDVLHNDFKLIYIFINSARNGGRICTSSMLG